jgi:hypothetical protein
MPAPQSRPFTDFAMQALALAVAFSETFSEPVANGAYELELVTPEGTSTDGGKRATQFVRLVPVAGGAPITIGWADPIHREAMLSSYAELKACPMDQPTYDVLAARIASFFTLRKLTLRGAARARDASESAEVTKNADDAQSPRPLVLILAGVFLFVGLAIAAAIIVLH